MCRHELFLVFRYIQQDTPNTFSFLYDHFAGAVRDEGLHGGEWRSGQTAPEAAAQPARRGAARQVVTDAVQRLSRPTVRHLSLSLSIILRLSVSCLCICCVFACQLLFCVVELPAKLLHTQHRGSPDQQYVMLS